MSFSIQLTPDLTPVEPGATTPVSVVVVNKSDAADRFEMEVEGIDPEWKAIPVPVFGVEPNETHTEKVFFKPRRDSESLAGNYPFVVRVRSLESGEQKTVQGVLQVRPFHHLSMEINPKKGFVSATKRNNQFEVALMNLGNTDHTVQLVGSDPEDACAYEFEQEQVTLSPGQQREVEVSVEPTSQPLFSGGRLIGFTVTGRSIDTSSVVTSSQAQLEQRSLFSPTSVIVAVILALMIGAWILMYPKRPTISLSVDPLQATQGDQVTIQWAADNASQVKIAIDDNPVYEGPELKGTRTVTLEHSGSVTIVAVASKEGRQNQDSRSVTVAPPAPVEPPTIVDFSVDHDHIKLGDSFILKYKFGPSVSRAVVQPVGVDLDLALNEQEVTPKSQGTVEYTVVAMNKKGESVQRTVKVTAVDESSAKIPVFRADPPVVKDPDTKTTLTWFITGSARVELSYNGQTLTDPTSPLTLEVLTKTTFTLTAWDSDGRPTVQKITVDHVAPTLPPTNPDGPPPDTGSTSTSGPPPISTGGSR